MTESQNILLMSDAQVTMNYIMYAESEIVLKSDIKVILLLLEQ